MLVSADMLCLVQSFQQAKQRSSKTRKLPFIKRKKVACLTATQDEHLLHPDNTREPPSTFWRHDKQGLSGSAPSVTCAPLTPSHSFTPSTCRSRQKKFLRHFQVDADEKVIDYFSCALVADILLQGHLYISRNYFAFYSNVFGYVTKLLIPTSSVVTVTKEKTAFILPNAVGVTTADHRHVFSSLLSRDTTYRLMVQVWREAHISRTPDIFNQSVTETDVDDSLCEEPLPLSRSEPVLDIKFSSTPGSDKQLKQTTATSDDCKHPTAPPSSLSRSTLLLAASTALLVVLFLSASVLMYRVSQLQTRSSSSRSLYEVQEFLDSNLKSLYKVRQSLEVLSLLLESEQENWKEIESARPESSKLTATLVQPAEPQPVKQLTAS